MKENLFSIKVLPPKHFMKKPLKAEFPKLLLALGKGGYHYKTFQWTSLVDDGVDAIKSFGLATPPGECLYVLIQNSIIKAVNDLLRCIEDHLPAEENPKIKTVAKGMDFSLPLKDLFICSDFFENPANLSFLDYVKAALEKILIALELEPIKAKALTNRFPSFFLFSLINEWRVGGTQFEAISKVLKGFEDSIFKAGAKQLEWFSYSAHLNQLLEEDVFGSSLSLRQLYVPQNAFYINETQIEPTRPTCIGLDNGSIGQEKILDIEEEEDEDEEERVLSSVDLLSPNLRANEAEDEDEDEECEDEEDEDEDEEDEEGEEGSDAEEFSFGLSIKKKAKVVHLIEELDIWLNAKDKNNAIRVISGCPGSGKSSFAKYFAAYVSEKNIYKVLMVPLYLLDPRKDIVQEVGRFVQTQNFLSFNPFDYVSNDILLLIFDGLDELASQGPSAAMTARNFLLDVEKVVNLKNHRELKVKVLILGRELAIQENESEFSSPSQVLTLLPYYVPSREDVSVLKEKGTIPTKFYSADKLLPGFECREEFDDPKKLLEVDLRQNWWKKFGDLTGKHFKCLPRGLEKPELIEVTSQPLLNYLVALSYLHDMEAFDGYVNYHTIYSQLLNAVYARGYEDGRKHAQLRRLSFEEFNKILQVIGLVTWHGDGRTTTISSIEKECIRAGLSDLLTRFKDGVENGLANLLLAFFFRKFSADIPGEPTFIFTHKSFGEFLAAKGIIVEFRRIVKKFQEQKESNREEIIHEFVIKEWAEICGQKPLTRFMESTITNELNAIPSSDLETFQEIIVIFICHFLQFELEESLFSSKNKEAYNSLNNSLESLLLLLTISAKRNKKISRIPTKFFNSFWEWFKCSIKSETYFKPKLNQKLFRYLDLSNSNLSQMKLEKGTFVRAHLTGLIASNSILRKANFNSANLKDSKFLHSNLKKASFERANLTKVDFSNADLHSVSFFRANLAYSSFKGANLKNADFSYANLPFSELSKSNIENVLFSHANLIGAKLQSIVIKDKECFDEAILIKADLSFSILIRCDFSNCDMQETVFKKSNLIGSLFICTNLRLASMTQSSFENANFAWARLYRATMKKSNFNGANFSEADLCNVNLDSCCFDHTNFSGAFFESAILSCCLFLKAKFQFSSFRKAIVKGCNFSQANFLESDLEYFIVEETNFNNTIMKKAALNYSKINISCFEGSDLVGSSFIGSKIFDSKMNNSNFSRSQFTGAKVEKTSFKNSNLYHTNFSFAELRDVDFSGCNLSYADLRNAKLERVNFKGAILKNTKIYRADANQDYFDSDALKEANLF